MGTITTRTMIEAAKRYAAADPSDPFAFSRCMTHLSTGVSSYSTASGEQAYYDADPALETRRLPDGTEYTHPVYRNRVRP
jgi:hypothetical protein